MKKFRWIAKGALIVLSLTSFPIEGGVELVHTSISATSTPQAWWHHWRHWWYHPWRWHPWRHWHRW